MTIFYDPKSRKIQPWIIVVFVLVPVVLVALFWFLGQKEVDKKSSQHQTDNEKDIFAK